MRAWAIYNGDYYSDGGFEGKAFKTKKAAVKWIRSQGFKYNKAEDLYLNDDIANGNGSFGQWYRLEDMEFINQ